MGAVHALIAEVTVDFEDAVNTTNDGTLQVQLRRNAQVEVNIQRIGVGDKRASGRATVQGLQHRGLDFNEVLAFQVVTQCAHDLHADHGVLAGLFADNEVIIALAHTGIFCHIGKGHRQRAQGLSGHGPLGDHDGQLAAAGGNYAATHGDEIAQVNIGLPRVEALLAYLGQRKHGLHLGAVAILQGGKAQLAGIAHKDKAAGNGVGYLGFLAWGQVGHAFFRARLFTLGHYAEIVAQILQRDGALNGDRVGLYAGFQQAIALLAADAQLLRDIVYFIILLLAHVSLG